MRIVIVIGFLGVLAIAKAQNAPGDSSELRTTRYHLTARPWAPLHISRVPYLDALEGACRFTAKHQNSDGAVIDVFTDREMQYSTPYFAYAVGTLVSAGRAKDLLPAGIAAMEHSTMQFGQGRAAVPDLHSEFFIAALTESLDVYRPLVASTTLEKWRSRLQAPIASMVGPVRNNWMTYSMKGEWLRYMAGLVGHGEAIDFIEDAWRSEQSARIFSTPFHLYHDRSSDPDTLSVEGVGRGNLLALIDEGYDGPSAGEIRTATEDGTATSLYLQDPTGQAPANGRTDDHVWVDVGYQLGFQVMANRAWSAGRRDAAAAYQHASELAFNNIARWRRTDGDWAGSYFITKSHFDPSLRVGYQDASGIANYTGSLMFHLAEAYNARTLEIPEAPAPAEIGGYSLTLDREFDSALANAGGLQVQLNLRGQTEKSSGNWWTPLGIVRISRAAWDSRLGPADGALTADNGVSLAPEFLEDGKWRRMAALSHRYKATWKVEFVHPALVRGTLRYAPVDGSSGPVFESHLWITPDAMYSETRKMSADTTSWGMTWPVLQNDGRPLAVRVGEKFASTSYPGAGDQESFLAVGDTEAATEDGPPMRSSFGDLLPLRVAPRHGVDGTFVYPHNADQPAAAAVQKSFRRTEDGFTSLLGSVHGDVYIGKTVAGGVGRTLTLAGRQNAPLRFRESCGFLVQLRDGAPIRVETDRDVVLLWRGKQLHLKTHVPMKL